MDIRIALAGNPNSGKTTLFNALTGSNQFVGNWPGVTVEKKEGKLRKHDNVTIVDLPGIYSLSPYTLEEVVARTYLLKERPDVILNIIDGTNLERNLYLTTQLLETGIPVVAAINMMDVVEKNGDSIETAKLAKQLGCKIVEISALRGTGVTEAAEAAVKAAGTVAGIPQHSFSGPVEHAIAHIEEEVLHNLPEERQRFYAIKLFERDSKVIEELKVPESALAHIEKDIAAAEKELDDDAESIITNERYVYISDVIRTCSKRRKTGVLTRSDKIDRIVTNRWLGLPIFALVMFLIYWIAMVGVGTPATDWVNDGLFGDGWHLLGIGGGDTEEAEEEYGDTDAILEGLIAKAQEAGIDTEDVEAEMDSEADDYDPAAAVAAIKGLLAKVGAGEVPYTLVDEETLEESEEVASAEDVENAIAMYEKYEGGVDPANYGVWVPGIPSLVESLLDKIGCADWLKGLILDGIIAGIGSVLGFVPQMLVLFFMLAALEACGYMARIAFVLDRIFRKFGLSGKSFIPMLIGVGCGVPGIMASRTIENERDRRMTIMTTTFIPCSAKVPFIGMVAGAIFGGSAWISTSAYFIGMASIIISGIILKKTKIFAGNPAPFVMELPTYHMPTIGNVLRSMWERGWSFIKKAGTIILLSTIFVWFTSYFGWVDGTFRMLSKEEIDSSILASIGGVFAWLFKPLGWGNWQAAVASVTGLVAKENIVGTMGILYGDIASVGAAFTKITGFSFLVFNLLCAPCFAAIGAIRREMNNAKWTWFAILYQCGFAYAIALMITQFCRVFAGGANVIGVIVSVAILAGMLYMLFVKKYHEATELTTGDAKRIG